jgi:hypothetical protein
MLMAAVCKTTHAFAILSELARRHTLELRADGDQAAVGARAVVQKEFAISQRVAICWDYWAVRMEGDRARPVILVGTLRCGATGRIAEIL